MSTPPQEPRPGLRARASAVSARVPTKWLGTVVLGLFLAVSAAFGGLNAAAAPALPEIAAGESFTGAQLRIQIDRAALIDAFPEQNIVPDDGKRLLVVVATVEDVWNTPASTLNDIGAADNIRPVGVPGLDATSEPRSVAILSDGTEFPELQPGVPVQLAFIWDVDPDAVADGDLLALDLYDKTYQAEGFVTYGERFTDPVVAAHAEVAVTDVGAGDEPDEEGAPDADAASAGEADGSSG